VIVFDFSLSKLELLHTEV